MAAVDMFFVYDELGCGLFGLFPSFATLCVSRVVNSRPKIGFSLCLVFFLS